MNHLDFDLSQDTYIAEMWAYANNPVRTAQRVEVNLQSIEVKLLAARDCPEDWLATWAQMTASSIGNTRDCHTVVISELEHLVQVYRDLLPKNCFQNTFDTHR